MNNKKDIYKTHTDADATIYGNPDSLVKDVAKLIDEARNHIAREYSSTQALLCWLIGKRIGSYKK